MLQAMFDDCLTLDQIERRKRSLVSELHPDAGGSNERFLSMMEAYNKAVERLNTPDRDRSGAQPQPQPNPQPVYPHYANPQGFYTAPVIDNQNNLAAALDNVMSVLQRGMEFAAKAAVVYVEINNQLDAIKADKRKKARKARKKVAQKTTKIIS